MLASKTELMAATAKAESAPEVLRRTILNADAFDTPQEYLVQARNRLSRVVLNRVKQSFLDTAVEHSRSEERAKRLAKFKTDLRQARSFLRDQCGPQCRDELRNLEVDGAALDAVARAQALEKDAKSCAAGELPDEDLSASRTLRRSERAEYESAREYQLMQVRAKIVKDAMQMLQEWQHHKDVTHALCSALLAMAESGEEDFLAEMDRRGLSALAFNVADHWQDVSDIARVSLRLIGRVSVQVLIDLLEADTHSQNIVLFGLEVLNKRAREDLEVLDEIVACGGREMLDLVEPMWEHCQWVALHALNLRRRMKRSKAKSRRTRREVQMPPEDVLRLRALFDSIDNEGTGSINAQQLQHALQMVGIKPRGEELAKMFAEVDADGSGLIEWPEFLFLMSKFGESQSLESQFSSERLAEMREVFSLFDKDNSGTLDVKELGMVMRSIGLHAHENDIRAMINEVDADGSGQIEWPEFLYLMSRNNTDAENQHRLAFEFFDRERLGRISRADFIAQMQMLSSDFTVAELDEMIIDSKFEDSDMSSLTFKEFVKMMMRE